jgi:hypothetical protein
MTIRQAVFIGVMAGAVMGRFGHCTPLLILLGYRLVWLEVVGVVDGVAIGWYKFGIAWLE